MNQSINLVRYWVFTEHAVLYDQNDNDFLFISNFQHSKSYFDMSSIFSLLFLERIGFLGIWVFIFGLVFVGGGIFSAR